MIKCEVVKTCPCDNCGRLVDFTLTFEFYMNNVVYNKLVLCEDCSYALGILHKNVMELHEPYKYDMDEITSAK